MSLVGILIGLMNCILLAAILVLLGAIVQWILSAFQWPVPPNIVKIFMAIVALMFLICVISLLIGAPMVHFIHLGAKASAFIPIA